MDNNKIQTIFKLRRYIYYSRDIQKGYPTIRLHESSTILFLSLCDAENKIKELAIADNLNPRMEVCAYTIVEMPIGYPYDDGETLSQRIYSSDGTLWGEEIYSITKQEHQSVYDFIGKRVNFNGRDGAEIKHAVGDIVEIFGHKENIFHRENYAELAIITKVPPTKQQIAKRTAKIGDDYEVILMRDPTEKLLCQSISVLPPRFTIDAELEAKAYTILKDNHLNDEHNSEHIEQENEKYAEYIANKFGVEYYEGDSLSCPAKDKSRLEKAHDLMKKRMKCGNLKYSVQEDYYYFTFQSFV